MHASAKYLIHATVRTNGVVERSDVVGAIFGQTEGLLGDQLEIRNLQESSKLGRIDVDIDSENGRSVGEITISSGLDRVETAVLAAALETIDRVGPCRAECTVTTIEDARAAKRRELIDRATELLADLEDESLTSEELLEEVRKQARVDEITEYAGVPAGPRVETSDAIIVVEGRADVRRLLKFGIRNAVAVEGTDVPEEVASLTEGKNTTAFLDGDRGGDLILRELQQVGDVDYVAFAPAGRSVEDLDRTGVLSALRRKVPLEQVTDDETPRDAFEPSASTSPEPDPPSNDDPVETDGNGGTAARDEPTTVSPSVEGGTAPASTEGTPELEESGGVSPGEHSTATTEPTDAVEDGRESTREPETLSGHVDAVVTDQAGAVRLLDGEFGVLTEGAASEAFEVLSESESSPEAVVLDGTLDQRLLDLAAQRGVGQIVTAATGEFVKQPTDVRIRTASEFDVDA